MLLAVDDQGKFGVRGDCALISSTGQTNLNHELTRKLKFCVGQWFQYLVVTVCGKKLIGKHQGSRFALPVDRQRDRARFSRYR